MLISEIIEASFPSLDVESRIGDALDLIEEYELDYLPIVQKGSYLGLAPRNWLELMDPDQALLRSKDAQEIYRGFTTQNEPIVSAVKKLSEANLPLLPVVSKQDFRYEGAVLQEAVLASLSKILGSQNKGAIILLEMENYRYSFGELSRLIETNDAAITQLNTYIEESTGLLLVSMKLNKWEISPILSTFNRYEYTVRYSFGEELISEEIKSNYDNLMLYLNQ